MKSYDPVAVAKASLTQARAYQPANDADRRTVAANIARLEAFITSRQDHPAAGGPRP